MEKLIGGYFVVLKLLQGIILSIFGISTGIWLHEKGYLVWIIAILAVSYLIVYLGIGTLFVFMGTLDQLGQRFQISFARSPLMTIIFIPMMVISFWIAALIAWPMFLIPNSALSKEEYDAIDQFEAQVEAKYE